MRALVNKISKLKVLLIVTLLSSINYAHATLSKELKPVGQATLSWMFMDIYDASLYTASGRYKAQHYPQALTLLYHKNIT